MKITRAQKDAVISLLKEKHDQKQEEETKKFLEEHEVEVALELEEYKGFVEKLKDLLTELNNVDKAINTLFERSKYLNNRCPYNKPRISHSYYDNKGYYIENDFTENPNKVFTKVDILPLDLNKVTRQLELDTLSVNFDIDKFIEKFLPSSE